MLYIYAVGKKIDEKDIFNCYFLRKSDALLELEKRKENGEQGIFIMPIELKESVISDK